MEAEIRRFFKDKYFAYHVSIKETGITLKATNKHDEVVYDVLLTINDIKEILLC